MTRKFLLFSFLGFVLAPMFFSCASQNEASHEHIFGDILIDFQKDAKHEEVLRKISKKYDIQHKSNVSPDLNIHLFSFNESKISVDDLIEKVKKIDGVENAQSNKSINNRNR